MNGETIDTVAEVMLHAVPVESGRTFGECEAGSLLAWLAARERGLAVRALRTMEPSAAAELLLAMSSEDAERIMGLADAGDVFRWLPAMSLEDRGRFVAALPASTRREIERLMDLPEDDVRRYLEPQVARVTPDMSARALRRRLRGKIGQIARMLYVVDQSDRLVGQLDLADLALADADEQIEALIGVVPQTVADNADRESVIAAAEASRVPILPVVDGDGRLLGIIRYSAIVHAMEEATYADVQTMVGAGRDERALSSPWVAVKNRHPWLQVNLLTAFLAASVVGLFEGTIARFTALAVLLPVVAGQSGNAGSQALAVTMRGLALREVGIAAWPRVLGKEVAAGLLNGVGIALTTGAGVFVWSGSWGLAGIICMSMVLSMVAAGMAGAAIPVVMVRLGQDPATSSSIILTTVTDVVGFFSFLGIATALSFLL
jgi:magnesium transporter